MWLVRINKCGQLRNFKAQEKLVVETLFANVSGPAIT